MHVFLITILFVLVLVLVLRLRKHARAVRAFREALEARQSHLREDMPGALGAEWDKLCAAGAQLIRDANSLSKRHEGQLAQLQATLGSLQEAVLIVDANNYVLLANQALQSMFPRSGKIVGERLERTLHSDAFLSLVEGVRSGRVQTRQEIEFVEGAGSTWFEVTGSAINSLSNEPSMSYLFVLHDITRQKRLEGVRKEFVANVSHELRTPLAVIKGYVETLVDSQGAISPADQEKFLKTIQRHTERLNSLLEDLLVLSRLESTKPGLAREQCDLCQWLPATMDDMRAQPAAAEHTIVLRIAPGVGKVFMDPLKIGQVFENLIGNAFKYTPAGSIVETTVCIRNADTIEFCVKDDGPGIPAADLPHVFERFYRVEKGRSREKGGTGLGLSIVKHIVQLHGGRVWAESREGQGTAFYFTLPAGAARQVQD
jgi:two-component system, OmpR family, phosphate regulon sensor histidine kinase PhoR